MENTVTATELARNLGDVLARVRYRRESFLVERNGRAVARVVPVASDRVAVLADALEAWSTGPVDTELADILDQVSRADEPPINPWDS
jgi:prevent-host-death family protein